MNSAVFSSWSCRSTLPDELLMFADKLSMAHGLEVRVPYLDKDIVEYVERLPASFKVHHGSQKRLHRQVCQDLLPQTILKRKKRGFAVNVVDDWFRGTMRSKMEDILMDDSSLLYQYLRPSVVQTNVSRNISRARMTITRCCLAWLLFEEWLRVQSSSNSRVGIEVSSY